ncbi:4-hydroxythreonine-4-phosphate dehydrogenase PdxA [Prosthecomicrobium hirschii]|uniref:4-hydroxythreonine-4-phosphate dehydrogenase PdxA n=1 Tax=Prosthecodimorpha hirschii TaxID=665126 RepID=UPI00221F5241|nr:4-hydroxythreonine-4-phosphate dehydrogenase PdxA [Prosthecomicrobium hirschii]MCW1840200.1 4-hydroxythreonine-4-phosphate dehydrogenase PdxA [Prosthecomicrobium hirschii]
MADARATAATGSIPGQSGPGRSGHGRSGPSAAPLPLALTLGEPGGIGLDVTLQAYHRHRDLPPFYLLGDADALARRAACLGLEVPIEATEPSAAAGIFARALPVVAVGHPVVGEPGRLVPADAPAVIASIETAVEHVRTGLAAAVVTNPINKHALYGAGFRFPGHTEFLGELARRFGPGPAPGGAWTPIMMLAGPELRTVPVTVHVALAAVPGLLTTDLIVETGRIVAADLAARFGLKTPRLAVGGLNPHAGENGTMGREDDAVVAPAVAALKGLGIDAFGPLPSDTMFHPAARRGYDAALLMYHDQALIPVKTIAFDETVNVTLGLPFVRTSPDHGTALDIAGTGRARPDSLVAALRLAARMAAADATGIPAGAAA